MDRVGVPYEKGGMCVGKFELNSWKKPIRAWHEVYLTHKRYHLKLNRFDYQPLFRREASTNLKRPAEIEPKNGNNCVSFITTWSASQKMLWKLKKWCSVMNTLLRSHFLIYTLNREDEHFRSFHLGVPPHLCIYQLFIHIVSYFLCIYLDLVSIRNATKLMQRRWILLAI